MVMLGGVILQSVLSCIILPGRLHYNTAGPAVLVLPGRNFGGQALPANYPNRSDGLAGSIFLGGFSDIDQLPNPVHLKTFCDFQPAELVLPWQTAVNIKCTHMY